MAQNKQARKTLESRKGGSVKKDSEKSSDKKPKENITEDASNVTTN